jgi:1-acyl-sn-glycerol-3-phosphate acyltransferase
MQEWSVTVLQALGVEVQCSGALPPSGSLIVANHRSYIDIAVIAVQTPCSFLAKKEVARWPLVGYGARRFANIVFVERNSLASRGQSMLAMRAILRAGVSVTLFPEGTTSRGPGVLPFQPGMFRLAAREGFPVVPAALAYRDPSDAWVGEDTFVGHFLKTFSKPRVSVTVHFGPVLKSSEGAMLQNGAWHWISSVLEHESRETS